MFIFAIYTIHVLISLFLIAVVLLQQGKGADLSVFGGGGTQTAFGARGAATLLHKLTVASFIIFIVTTLTIGVFQSNRSESGLIGGLPETVAEEAAESEAVEEEAAGALPVETEDAATDADEGTTDGEAPVTSDDTAGDAPAEADGDASAEGTTAESSDS